MQTWRIKRQDFSLTAHRWYLSAEVS